MPADVAERPEQRIVEAGVLVPPGGAITGWAALRWWTGCRWLEGDRADGSSRPVAIVAGRRRIRPQSGLLVLGESVSAEDRVEVDGIVVARPVAALSFEVRRAASDLRSAVVMLDVTLGTDAVSVSEMAVRAEQQARWAGVVRLRRALELADENSWSPQETRMRLRWTLDAGLPRPRSNAPVFVEGRHLVTPDLVDPTSGLVAEYDGSDHLTRERRLRDVRREETMRGAGLEIVTSLAGDSGPGGFVDRLRATRDRLAQTDRAAPSWSLDPPSWWVQTDSVDARRRLSQSERRRLLRHRVVA